MITELQSIIRPVSRLTEAELAYVTEVAKTDGHGTLAITHILERDKQPIGHLSICGIPLVLMWVHTKHGKIRDSLRLVDFYENTVRASGATAVLVPCSKDSPYYRFMEDVGYVKGDEMTMFFKQL